MSTKIKYPAEFLNLEEDARMITKYVRAINDPDTDEKAIEKLLFQVGLRLMRIEKEAKNVGAFIDLVGKESE